MSPQRRRYRTPFGSEHFSVDAIGQPASDGELAAYLRSARMSIESLSSAGRLQARLAHYPQITFASIVTPPIDVSWNRIRESRGRTLLLLARTGTIAIETAGAAIVRGRTSALIVPGDEPVLVRMEDATTELIYISASADVLPTRLAGLRSRVDREAVSWHRVAPLYLFVHSLASAPPHGEQDPRMALSDPANAVAVALAAAISADIIPAESLFDRAQEHLASNFANSNVSLASVAKHFSVAPRTLQAAYTEQGATFSHELRALRVNAARRVHVEQPGVPAESVAKMTGFTSLSAMYRALRADSSAGEVSDVDDRECESAKPPNSLGGRLS